MTPRELYADLFLGRKSLLTAIIGAAIEYKNVSVERSGESFLDRKVTPADVSFMRNTQLKDIEFRENKEPSKFDILNTSTNKSLTCSNRDNNHGEIRGAILKKALRELKNSHPELNLYDAMEKIFSSDFVDTDLFTALMRVPGLDTSNRSLMLQLCSEVIDVLPEQARELEYLAIEEQNKHLSYYTTLLKPIFGKHFGISSLKPQALVRPDTRSTLVRNKNTFILGMACLALLIAGLALTATGVFAALGIPLLFVSSSIALSFIVGSACAINIIYEEITHRQALLNYELLTEQHDLQSSISEMERNEKKSGALQNSCDPTPRPSPIVVKEEAGSHGPASSLNASQSTFFNSQGPQPSKSCQDRIEEAHRNIGSGRGSNGAGR